jgi:hypothetical protein
MSASRWIKELNMIRHPEGGYYSEFYRSNSSISREGLPEAFAGDRSFLTSIYFLLEGKDVSKFHRLKSDEMWYFLDGSELTIHIIDKNGDYSTKKLGRNPIGKAGFQQVVPAGNWFGSSVDKEDSYALVACAVGPGFDFQDFELCTFDKLVALYPQHKEIISKLS